MLAEESLTSALDAIKANLLRSILTALAIIIGTAAVIALVSIGGSAQKAIENSISDMGSQVLSVVPGQKEKNGVKSAYIPLKLADVRALENEKSINWKIAPEMRGNKQVKFTSDNANLPVVGTTSDYFLINGIELTQGNVFTKNDLTNGKKVAIIGSDVAKELGTTRKEILYRNIFIGDSSYRVIGITEPKGSGGWDNPDERIFVPVLAASERIFGRVWINMIVVKSASEFSLPQVMIAIERILRRTHDISPGEDNDFRVFDWSEVKQLQKETPNILTTMITSIASIRLLVGGIGVMNIMLVSVTERTREIGIRKAIGAKKKEILEQFLIESVLISFLGGGIGILLGIGISRVVSGMGDWETVVSTQSILLAFGFSVAIGIFFGFYPANKAANLNPIDALRYE